MGQGGSGDDPLPSGPPATALLVPAALRSRPLPPAEASFKEAASSVSLTIKVTHGGDPGILSGKRGLIMGLANNRSIAWGIAQAARQHGAELAFTYQGDALKKRVEPLAHSLNGHVIGHCDVTEPATIDAVFEEIEKLWESLDFVVHCIAFSDKDELTGRYIETSEDNFTKSLLISCYSFTAIAQRAEKLMTKGGSLLTLTYYGAEKWMPHYNVMGVAKAALKAPSATSRPISGLKTFASTPSRRDRSRRWPPPASATSATS